MPRGLVVCLALPGLVGVGASKVFLRSAFGHDHRTHAHSFAHNHNPGLHIGGGGHHGMPHLGGHGHSGAYVHNGVIHRPPAAHRDVPPPPSHDAAPHAAPMAPPGAGLPHNPYDQPAGQQYVPPPGHPMASPSGGLTGMGMGGMGGFGGMGGMGGMGGFGGMGNVLPAVAAGTAIAHMAGHHGGPRGAGAAMGEWQSLTVCNGYASRTPLTMVHWQGQFKKTGSPLLYKTCRAHDQILQDGDNFTFQLGDAAVGSFNITHAASRAFMALVVTRDARNATKTSFVAHTFRGNAPQAAMLVDAYGGEGAAQAKAKVLDGQTSLDFSQEVALKPGAHLLSLAGSAGSAAGGANASQVPVEVPGDGHAKYLLARVGYAGPTPGESFPEELLVLSLPLKPVALPTPPPAKHSAAAAGALPAAPLLLLAVAGAVRAAMGPQG